MRGNWKGVALAVLTSVGGTLLPSPEGNAQSYNWVTVSQLEASNSDGSSLFATQHSGRYPSELVGVVVNKPADMLDYTASSTSSSGGQFQVFVQALSSGGTYGGYTVPPGDFGGVAVYEGQKVPWDSSQNFTNDEWTAELARIGASTLKVGDVVLVQAKTPGVFYNGKFNINTNHLKSPDNQFSITVLGQTAPTAVSIALSALKDSSNNFIFDYTRASGCEEYQGSLVHLDNLLLTDPGDWGSGKTVMVSQGNLTFPMQVGLDSGLELLDPNSLASHPFGVTAILDQEGGDYQAGYSLWLTNASNLAVPEPSSLALLATAGVAVFMFGCRRIVRRLAWLVS